MSKQGAGLFGNINTLQGGHGLGDLMAVAIENFRNALFDFTVGIGRQGAFGRRQTVGLNKSQLFGIRGVGQGFGTHAVSLTESRSGGELRSAEAFANGLHLS